MIARSKNEIAEKMKSVLFQREGRLTRELLLTPGEFGLGKVPGPVRRHRSTTLIRSFLDAHVDSRQTNAGFLLP